MTAWNYFKRSIKRRKRLRSLHQQNTTPKKSKKMKMEIEVVKTERLGYKIAYVFDVSLN